MQDPIKWSKLKHFFQSSRHVMRGDDKAVVNRLATQWFSKFDNGVPRNFLRNHGVHFVDNIAQSIPERARVLGR